MNDKIIRDLSNKIKWIGGHGQLDNIYTLNEVDIAVYNGRKIRGEEKWKYIVVIKFNNKHITDFEYTYGFKKMGNKGVARMLIDNKYRIIIRLFK